LSRRWYCFFFFKKKYKNTKKSKFTRDQIWKEKVERPICFLGCLGTKQLKITNFVIYKEKWKFLIQRGNSREQEKNPKKKTKKPNHFFITGGSRHPFGSWFLHPLSVTPQTLAKRRQAAAPLPWPRAKEPFPHHHLHLFCSLLTNPKPAETSATDTTKRLMSFPKCRSIEVINNPARPGSNHREVNCINYR